MSETLREGVERLLASEDASAVLYGVVGTTPDTYGGVTTDEALEHAGVLLTDLRALLAATDEVGLVHNHPPYRPVCNERRLADGRLRGACLLDEAVSDPVARVSDPKEPKP